MIAPSKKGNIGQWYWYNVSQGLTGTPGRGTIQLDISHHFLAFTVEEAQVCVLQPSRATSAFDHHLLPLLGFHTNDRVNSEVLLILRSPLISLKPTCSPNGSFAPRKDWEWRSVFSFQYWLVSRETFSTMILVIRWWLTPNSLFFLILF